MGHRRRVEQPHRQLREVGHVVGLELRAAVEAGEAVVDVGAEAGLAHLAVADDVDARLALLRDHLGDGGVDPRLELSLVDLLAVEPLPDHVREIVRPRKAARMRRQDSFVSAAISTTSSRACAVTSQ